MSDYIKHPDAARVLWRLRSHSEFKALIEQLEARSNILKNRVTMQNDLAQVQRDQGRARELLDLIEYLSTDPKDTPK